MRLRLGTLARIVLNSASPAPMRKSTPPQVPTAESKIEEMVTITSLPSGTRPCGCSTAAPRIKNAAVEAV